MTINLTLSLTELCLFFASAIVLGVTLHHFTAHRKQPGKKAEENATDGDYAEHTDTAAAVEDAVVTALKDQLRLSVEKVNILTIESEEFRWRHRTFEVFKDELEKKINTLTENDNLHHLPIATEKRIAANA